MRKRFDSSSLLKKCILILSLMVGLTARSNAEDPPSILPVDWYTIFEEDFEQSILSPNWKLGDDPQSRARVASINGSSKLILDDASNDDTFSQTTVSIDFEIGAIETLQLDFDAENLSDEYQAPEVGLDAIELFIDGFSFHLDRLHFHLAENSSKLAYSKLIPIPTDFHEPGESHTLTLKFLQYGSKSTPNDGWLYDNIVLKAERRRELTVSNPASAIEDEQTLELTINLEPAPTSDLNLEIQDELGNAMGAVQLLSGQSKARFQIPINDDDSLNGDREIRGTVEWPGVRSVPWTFTLIDNEEASLALALPDQIREGFDSYQNNATLSIAPPPSQPLYVTLTSDIENQLGTTSILVPQGATEIPFTLRAYNDPFETGDRTVQITAVLGINRSAPETVKIIEDDRLVPSWDTPDTSITEGDNGLYKNLYFGGAAFQENKSFHLVAEPDGILEFSPADFTVEAGNIFGPGIILSATENSSPNPDRVVILTAFSTDNSIEPIDLEVTIKDNDIAGYRIQCGPFLNANQAAELKLFAINLDGTPNYDFSNSLDLFLVGDDGVPRPWSILPQINISNGQYTRALPDTSELEGQRLLAKDSLGRSGETIHPFSLFKVEPLELAQVATRPSSEFIYGYVQSDYLAGNLLTPRNLSGHIVEIDPNSMAVKRSLYLGNNIRDISTDTNSLFLYASTYGEAYKIDLTSFTTVATIALKDSNGAVCNGYNIRAIDGTTGKFAFSGRNETDNSLQILYFSGDSLIDELADGLLLPYDNNQIDTLFAYQSLNNVIENNSLTRIVKYATTDTGLLLEKENPAAIQSYVSTIAIGNDWLVSPRGEVLDTTNLNVHSRLDIPDYWSPTSQTPNIRPHVINERNETLGASGKHIALFELESGIRSFTGSFEGLPSAIQQIHQIGSQTLLLQLALNKVVVLKSNMLLPAEQNQDIELSLTSSITELPFNTPFDLLLTLTNHSENDIAPVNVTLSQSERAPIESITSSTDEKWIFSRSEEGTLDLSLLQIKAGKTVTFHLTVTFPHSRALQVQAALRSPSGDTDLSNNLASLFLEPSFTPVFNQWQSVASNGSALAYSESKNLILVGTRENASPIWDRSLIGIDPDTGHIAGRVFLGAIPTSIEIDPSGRYAYVSSQLQVNVRKIDLETWNIANVFAVKINTPSAAPEQVVPLGEKRFLFTHHNQGTRLFDETHRQTITLPYNQITNIVRTEKPDILFGTYNDSLYKLTVDGTQLSVESITPSESTIFADTISESNGILFMRNGSTFDTETNSSLPAFPSEKILNNFMDYRGKTRLAIEPEHQRAFANSAQAIHSLDTKTRAYLRSLIPPAKYGEILTFRRFGAQGFAVLFSDTSIQLIHSDLVPTGEPSSLDLTIDIPEILKNINSTILSGQIASPSGAPTLLVYGSEIIPNLSDQSWEIELSNLLPGPNEIKIVARDGDPNIPDLQKSFVIQNELPGDADRNGMLDDWEAQYLAAAAPELRDPYSDPDGDGNSNRAEFLFGTNPLAFDSLVQIRSKANNTVEISLKRHKNAKTDFELESSSDGQHWTKQIVIFKKAGESDPSSAYETIAAEAPISPSNTEPLFRVLPSYTP